MRLSEIFNLELVSKFKILIILASSLGGFLNLLFEIIIYLVEIALLLLLTHEVNGGQIRVVLLYQVPLLVRQVLQILAHVKVLIRLHTSPFTWNSSSSS